METKIKTLKKELKSNIKRYRIIHNHKARKYPYIIIDTLYYEKEVARFTTQEEAEQELNSIITNLTEQCNASILRIKEEIF